MVKALLVSVEPEERAVGEETDYVITAAHFEEALRGKEYEAVLVRTLPNDGDKLSKNYSSTNPPYFEKDIVPLLDQANVKHFLVDLPSVDRENDNGELAFHHAFWGVPDDPRFDRTITELIFVPDGAQDGTYLLNLETAPFVNDATPSRPVLFRLHRNEEDQ
jgi:hypothetical protein